jgi:hypothetical protein
LAVAAAGYGAWRVWKNRPRSRPKLPHEIALEKIGAAMPLIDRGEPDAFSTAVSNAVRTYIEQRFNAKAAHRTTEEFLHDLLAQPTLGLGQYSDLLAEFLRHCDLAKFARWPLTADEMRSMADSARRFVTETVPAPEGKPQPQPVKAEEVAV